MTNNNGNTPPLSPASLSAKPKRKYTRRKAEGPFAIEKGIPMPDPIVMHKYPWAQMQVGDSFFVPNGPKSLFGTCSTRTKEGPNGYVARSAKAGKVSGIRVWRTK